MTNHFSHWHILMSIVVGPSRTVRILPNGNSECSELANMALGRQTQVGEGDLLWNKVHRKVISRKWHVSWDLKDNKLLVIENGKESFQVQSMESIWPVLGIDRRSVCGSTVSQAESHTGWVWRGRPFKSSLQVLCWQNSLSRVLLVTVIEGRRKRESSSFCLTWHMPFLPAYHGPKQITLSSPISVGWGGILLFSSEFLDSL